MNSNSYIADTAKESTIPVNRPEYHVTVEKRSLDVYAKAGDAV